MGKQSAQAPQMMPTAKVHSVRHTSSILQPSTQSRVRAMASVSRCEISDAAGSAPSMEIKLHGSDIASQQRGPTTNDRAFADLCFQSVAAHPLCRDYWLDVAVFLWLDITILTMQETEQQADACARCPIGCCGGLWSTDEGVRV